MTKPLNLVGQQFTRLTVVSRNTENDRFGNARWNCVCTCGNTLVVLTGNLKNGRAQSCGCLNKEIVSKISITHGLTNSAEYVIWQNIKDRCYNKKKKAYAYYGGRGIVMSDEWRDSFEAFYRDMGPRPSPAHTVDREKNDRGYFKENCRWATWTEQANNRSNNLLYEYRDEKKTLAEWCRQLGLKYVVVWHRIHRLGWSFKEAIQPIEHKAIAYDGETHTLEVWCQLLSLKRNKTYLRILRGESFEDIVKE